MPQSTPAESRASRTSACTTASTGLVTIAIAAAAVLADLSAAGLPNPSAAPTAQLSTWMIASYSAIGYVLIVGALFLLAFLPLEFAAWLDGPSGRSTVGAPIDLHGRLGGLPPARRDRAVGAASPPRAIRAALRRRHRDLPAPTTARSQLELRLKLGQT